MHPYHYGPPPETSGAQSEASTPASERPRRLSDPSAENWEGGNFQWTAGPWGGDGLNSNQQLPQMAYGDGPPYSEDEDLHSPVVVSSRQKSSFPAAGGRAKGRSNKHDQEEIHIDDEDYFAHGNGEGNAMHHTEELNGTQGELETNPADQQRGSTLAPSRYAAPGQRDSHFAATLPNRSYRQDDEASEDSEDSDGSRSDLLENANDSRYSKDYQFTIASPDEEMHGKAVALFDFARENENELPLVEGQVIWVSYRHGQGWLVAEDPKTRESGLVPEEYVRLFREMEGGWNSLGGDAADEHDVLSPVLAEPQSAVTPTQAEPSPSASSQTSNGMSNGSEKRPPIVSTFSTSSKDLDRYPQHLLEKQAGQHPPQVVHYGSQTNTPTIASPAPGSDMRRGGSDTKAPTRGTISRTDAESDESDDSDDSDEEFHDSKEQWRTSGR